MPRTGTVPKNYLANPAKYKLLEEVGHGASATVYRAIYIPFNEVVAVKCLDLDRCNSNLDDIMREAQTMSLIDHPNVVTAYCSFVVERNLWVVMPFMDQGSCLHLMKIAHPDGFEQPSICTILKETLKAIEYLHKQGHIHRDVKAGNILLDNTGFIKLADFGVTACMFEKGDRKRSRNTFVGTPCWMAPEVLQPESGYDFKADIWSFGITALELAHGHAPFSKYPPMKVLLMTIQNAPPGLDYDRDKKFSKSFKEMVAMCLVKDQKKRPTAEKLLKHSFFKHAKPPELSVKKLFADLPPLWDRVRSLQLKDAASLALKKMPSAEEEALSQSEYKRGVSAWNFDIEDLKSQASLIQDDDELTEIREGDESVKSASSNKDTSDCGSCSGKALSTYEEHSREQLNNNGLLETNMSGNKGKSVASELPELQGQGNNAKLNYGPGIELGSITIEEAGKMKNIPQPTKGRQSQSGPLTPGAVLGTSLSEKSFLLERSENGSLPTTGKSTCDIRKAPSFSGPLMLPNRASANSLSAPIKSSAGFKDSLDDKAKANLVQIKGRFSVTSESVDLVKDIPSSTISRRSQGSSPLRKSASVGDWTYDAKQMPTDQLSKDLCNGSLHASLLMNHLQNLFQQTSTQQDLIMNLLTNLQPTEAYDAPHNGKIPTVPVPRTSENGNIGAESGERERLLVKISELQTRMDSLTEELNAERLKYQELQQQLSAFSVQEEEDEREEMYS